MRHQLPALLITSVALPTIVFAQGSLEPPPGDPSPTQKSLQEVWDKLEALESQNAELETKLSAQEETAASQSALLDLVATKLGVSLPWQITTVDTVGYQAGNHYTSLAYGPDGQPAICYFDFSVPSEVSLKFARFDGKVWQISIVDGHIDYPLFSPSVASSLSFDTVGQPAIAYRHAAELNLKFAAFDGSTWQVTTVDSGGSTGTGIQPSLAFSPTGLPVIAYYDSTIDALKFASFDGSTWQTSIVDADGNVGSMASVAFAPSGLPAISYHDGTNSALKFAAFDGSSWQISTIDADGNVGLYTSLAYGPDGQPAISYFDLTNPGDGDLKIAVFDGSTWQISTVDAAGDVGGYSSLAFSPAGKPAISYEDDTNNGLKFAIFDGSDWQVSVVDVPGVFGFTSLAFNPEGQPAISYYHVSDRAVKFATRAPFTGP